MSDSGPPPGGGEGQSLSPDNIAAKDGEEILTGIGVKTPDSNSNSSTSTTGAWGSDGKQKCQGRNYADIVNESKKNQKNTLYINLEKEDDTKKVPCLSKKDILDIFNKLNINIDDIQRCAIHSRHDIKEVHLKPCIDASSFLGPMFVHAGWKVMTSTVKSSVTKVRFRNVPIYVPDEELFHLASFFGKVKDDLVTYERHKGDSLRGLENGTRAIDMELTEGKSFMNYIWLAGPLPVDKLARITIAHDGQKQQCSNCLRTAHEGCPAGAVGKLCREMKTDTMSVENYMRSLNENYKYKSLKDQYLSSLANPDPVDGLDIINSTVKNMTAEIELKEKITHQKAQLKTKENHENEKAKKLELIKKSVMEE